MAYKQGMGIDVNFGVLVQGVWKQDRIDRLTAGLHAQFGEDRFGVYRDLPTVFLADEPGYAGLYEFEDMHRRQVLIVSAAFRWWAPDYPRGDAAFYYTLGAYLEMATAGHVMYWADTVQQVSAQRHAFGEAARRTMMHYMVQNDVGDLVSDLHGIKRETPALPDDSVFF